MQKTSGLTSQAAVVRVFCSRMIRLALSVALLASLSFSTWADGVDEAIGLTELREALGNDAPTGNGVKVSQIEASSSAGWYFIDTENPLYADIRFVDKTGENETPNGHTHFVGRHFFGREGVSPGVRDVDIYRASDWYVEHLLGGDLEEGGEPAEETSRVQNHSWVAYLQPGWSANTSIRILRMMDYLVDRDQVTSVVTLQNGSLNDLPDLLCHSYNTIAVGLSSGEHSHGITTFDLPGRTKPDIVVPSFFTSFAAPRVSGAATLLIETADGRTEWHDARRPQVVKALLLAGATKEEFPNWSRDWFRPLDAIHGAGELHVKNSHDILTSGRATSFDAQRQGWDFRTIPSGGTTAYTLEIPEGTILRDLSIALTWHREFVDGDPGELFEPVASLSDLDLRLQRVGDAGPLDESLSKANNVEHIYQRLLLPGTYVIEVEAQRERPYGIAWRSTLEEQPAVLDVQPDGNGGLIGQGQGTPGRTYNIETSQDLTTWELVGQVTAATELFEFPITDGQPFEVCRLRPIEE